MNRMRACCVLLTAMMAATAWASDAVERSLEFTDTICDLGTIVVGSGYHQCCFEFTNQSDADVSIIGALSACGCTVPAYPKQPIRHGEKGMVTVTYDATGRPEGEIDKTITLITTGCPQRINLHITGEAISFNNTFH